MESDILRQHSLALSHWPPKYLQTPHWWPRREKKLLTPHWWTPNMWTMNTQNKEDIPTRNFKRKKKQQKHPKLETDDFPRGTKKKRKQNKTPPPKKKKKKIEKQQQQKKKKKKKPAKHREKFSNVSAELSSRTMQNGRKYQTMWNFFFLSKTHTISFNTFSLTNVQNKVTFFNFHSPYFYFGFCRHMVYLSHYLTKPPTTTRNFRGPKKTHTTPLCHFLGSLTFFFFPKWHFVLKKKKNVPRGTQKRFPENTSD